MSAAPPKAPAAPKSAQDYFGSGNFDEDHFGDAGGGLSLQTDESPRGSGTRDVDFGTGPSLPTGGGSLDLGTGGEDLDLYEKSSAEAAVAAQPSFDRRAWPKGDNPDSASLRIDAVEVTLAAGFRQPPSFPLLSPLYTFDVLTRRRALKEKIRALGEALEAATSTRDELLVRLVRDRRGKILMSEQGEALFEPIVAIERVALERRSALSGTNAEYDKAQSEFSAELQKIEGECDRQMKIVEERKASLADVSRALERQEAKKKRLYIELTGIVELQEKAAGASNPAQAARAAELEKQIADHAPDLDRARKAVEASRAVLGAAEAELRTTETRGRNVAKRRKTQDTEFQAQIGARSEGVRQAEKERLDAFATVARRVLAEKGRLVEVDTETLDAISKGDGVVLERATELEKYVRALDAHDDPTFKRGIAVAGAALLVVILLVVFLATR